MAGPEVTSKGVDRLIAQLREDGVAAGQAEAARLKAEAETQAAHILAEAREQADRFLKDARTASDRYRAAGEEALNTAMRDALLTMKQTMMAQFATDLRRMISKTTADPDMLKQMILELVGRARDAAGAGEDTEIILPAEAIGPEAIVENPELIQSGKLTEFTMGLTQEMVKKGVTLYASDDLEAGIRAHVRGKDMELDLSDQAIAALLMQHLQPRFRAVMEGVIK